MLVHETDTVIAQDSGGDRKADLLTVDPHPAPGVGIVKTRQDFDERRLAGTVLTNQSMYLTALDREVYAIKRVNTTKTL